ncbi:MAG: hypothetical protein ACRDIY_16330 [Chloroflexota bacterium]
MPLTTAQAFDSFHVTISPTDAQRADITSKQQATESYLRAAFPSASTMPLKRVILTEAKRLWRIELGDEFPS